MRLSWDDFSLRRARSGQGHCHQTEAQDGADDSASFQPLFKCVSVLNRKIALCEKLTVGHGYLHALTLGSNVPFRLG